MDGSDTAVGFGEAAHRRRDQLAVLAAAGDTLVERVAEGVDRLLPLSGILPAVAGNDADAERTGALLHRRVEFGDHLLRLFERMGLRIFRMCRPAMVALDIVLDRQLPVGLEGIHLAMRHLGLAPAVLAGAGAQRLLDRVEIEWLFGKRDEHQPGGDPHMEFLQPMLGAVEILRHQTRGAQRAVVGIGPGVVGAHEHLRVALLLGADLGAAMAAYVEHRMHGPVRRARQNHRLVAEVEQFEIARVGNDAFMGDAMPMAEEHPLHVALVDRRIVIEGAHQAVTRPALGNEAVDFIRLA